MAPQTGSSEPQIKLDKADAPATVEVADRLIYNARVYSLAWPDPDGRGVPHATAPQEGGVWRPDADHIALANGKVLAIGSAADTHAYVGARTEKIDLTVLDLDPFTIAPGAERTLLDGQVLRTMVAGRWVYSQAPTTTTGGPVARAGL